MELTLESLGLSQEELQGRVVNALAERVLAGIGIDDDGTFTQRSQTAEKLQEKLRKHIDAAIDDIAAKHVHPNVTQFIENLCLQETNKWGEKAGAKLTFIEYLVARAENYLREPVNYEGKAKGEDSYSWSAKTTRIAHMVDRHLQFSIESAMKAALANANAAIVGGIEAAVKIKLDEVSKSLKVSVQTK